MKIYLLSNNKKYIEYWKRSVDAGSELNIENIDVLQASDILIVDYELYLQQELLVPKVIVLDNEPKFEKSLDLYKKNVKAYGNIYMHKSHIDSAIQSVKENKIWMYPDFIAKMIGLNDVKISQSQEEKMQALTQREKEITQCILDGLTNKEISNQLSISTNTIKVHTKNIYNKLNVTDRLTLYSLLK